MNKTVVSSSSSSGIGFCGLLCIAFIVLKLIGVISWSWWWVLAPLWIPTCLGLSFIVIAVFVYCLLLLRK